MAEAWDEDAETLRTPFPDGGRRPPGMGRGYKPLNNNSINNNNNNVDNYRVGTKVDNPNRATENNNGDRANGGAEVDFEEPNENGRHRNGDEATENGRRRYDRNGDEANENGRHRNDDEANQNGSHRYNDRNGDKSNENVRRRYNNCNDEETNENGRPRYNEGLEDFKNHDNEGESTNKSKTSDDYSQSFNNRSEQKRSNRDLKDGIDQEIPDKPAPVTYIPPEILMDDDEIFSGVTAGLNFSNYDKIKVIVNGDNPPEQIDDFAKMGLRNIVIDNIVKSGYTKPTPIQKHAIPIIMNGRDMMACAQTGSGKTAAFMIPMINTLLERPSPLEFSESNYCCKPHCLIISPTRELVEQTWRQALKFSKDSILKCVAIYGGVSTRYNAKLLSNGCHILVTTPGRLIDFLDTKKHVNLESLRYVVLDEADRMLDMGFFDEIKKIMVHMTMADKKERQTLMFSATFGEHVNYVAREFLSHDYLFLEVGEIGSACTDVEQVVVQVEKIDKRYKLMKIFDKEDKKSISKTLIFVELKKLADWLAAFLSMNKIPTTSIHGDRMQQQREEALRDFKTGKMPVLVATGVASRGLDIKGVAHVINYDMPQEIDEYIHRIGRTGRVGNRGKATSFFAFEKDTHIATDLVGVLKKAGQQVPDWLERVGGYRYGTKQAGDTFDD